jgi:hypothetical protein
MTGGWACVGARVCVSAAKGAHISRQQRRNQISCCAWWAAASARPTVLRHCQSVSHPRIVEFVCLAPSPEEAEDKQADEGCNNVNDRACQH